MEGLTYLRAAEAAAIDEELMSAAGGFSLDQLMELAGLSVAQAVAAEYPPQRAPRVLVLAGPGNNGGDGLVAARHLTHFGYHVQVCYPKQTDKALYQGLVTQCRALGIAFLSAEEVLAGRLAERCDLLLDAIFGFSFKGSPRPPFDALLQSLRPSQGLPPVVSVDIPSGWHVELGDQAGDGLRPDMLVSLTAPKLGARAFTGAHWLGGRFVPPAIRDKYALRLPPFPGSAQCVRLAAGPPGDPASSPSLPGQAAADGQPGTGSRDGGGGGGALDLASLRQQLTQAEGLTEEQMDSDPLRQFDVWMREAVAAQVAKEPNAMALATADDQGVPSVRMVLLKGCDQRGFIWYTNRCSRKGAELANGRAALAFWWEPLNRQVRVEGAVEQLPDSESDAFFRSRPRGSQVGAHVSPQSQVLEGGRAQLDQRLAHLTQVYYDDSVEVPRPADWGGYLLRPLAIEFWAGRPSRLHDRLRYTRSDLQQPWHLERLAP